MLALWALFPVAAGAGSAAAQKLEQWTLSERPVVQIGVVEGEEAYQLHNAVSAVRLTDGRIAVLNAGTQQLRFFDARGRFQKSVGGRGSGPGEFRRPERLYRGSADSVYVYDSALRRESWYDGTGELARTTPDTAGYVWKRDVWLYRHNFVDGPAQPALRDAVRSALDRLPALRSTAEFRYVKVDSEGRLWVRPGHSAAGQRQQWTIHRTDGSPLATLITPAGFELYQTGGNFVLGRSRDDLDVEYIQLYELAGRSTSTRDAAAIRPAAAAPATVTDAVRRRMQAVLREFQRQQELYFSKPESGYRYTDRADRLELPHDMKDLAVHIVRADAQGYTVFVVHELEPLACGLSVGAGGPVGWTAGVVTCG
jgi:hypothetical protein